MSLSEPVMSVLCEFESVFSQPTWRQVHVLILGTLLARGRRTVTAALRQMGWDDASSFSLSHHVLNRARWSALALSRRLLVRLVRTFVAAGGALTCAIDETLERRWGHRINIRGHDRDPLASSQQRSVATSGVRWMVLTLIITPPWTQRAWALPVLSVPAPTPEVSRRLGRRHQTVPCRARQMRLAVRRWLPGVKMTLLGDHTSSVHELGEACARRDVRLVAPLRMDAALYEPAPPRPPGTNGRPRVKGARLPQLKQVLKAAHTPWHRLRVRWDQRPPSAGRDQRNCRVGLGLGSPGCPSGGCSCAIPQGAWSHAPTSRRAPTISQASSCISSSHAGALKRPSRRAAPIWGSKRHGNGRIAPSSAPRPVCWGVIPWSHGWPMRGIPMGRSPSEGPLGTLRPTRPLQRCWRLFVSISGAM
jgi:DDE superfamily endonuclease